MLSLHSVTTRVYPKGKVLTLLNEITAEFEPGQLVAIVGPSGCGKTTLIKTIAGMNDTSEGRIVWKGQDLEEKDFAPCELGYVPQFSIASEDLTVMENIRYASQLRISTRGSALDAHIELILHQTGLTELADKAVKVLSGGQKRRLSLAIELTANPDILLCDEVTSGLDMNSEAQIVKLLKSLAKKHNKLVLSVTHSLENLEDYDAVIVLYNGVLAYHGPPTKVMKYFKARTPSGIYLQLPQLEPEQWHECWQEYRESFCLPPGDALKTSPLESDRKQPNFFQQTATLLDRRWKVFFRDKAQVYISLALIIGFPLLVMLFSQSGRDPIRKLSETKEANIFLELQNQAAVHQDQLTVGSAVSGIIMFQVVLLCLTGSNNSAREISGERQLWEKERLAGVFSTSYLTSKLFFLGTLVLIQSTVMAFMVEAFWQFRGDFIQHWISLLLINAAMTSVCLAISSLFKSPAQSSLLSIYLVGFQLPLSGAILALPALPEMVTRPFISAYWAWSGSIWSLQENIFTAVDTVSSTSLTSSNTSFTILGAHIIIGLVFTGIGINRSYTN